MPIPADHVERYLERLLPQRSELMRKMEAEVAEPKLVAKAVLVVDNLPMSGEVGLPEGADTFWSEANLASARAFDSGLATRR